MTYDLPHLKQVLKNFEESIFEVNQSIRKLTVNRNELSKATIREMDVDLGKDLSTVQLTNMQSVEYARNEIKQFIQSQETILINKSAENYASKTRSWFYSNLKSTKNDVLFDVEGLEYVKIGRAHV